MADIPSQGAMAMVKIDGAKVKQLREQNGLTQLYIATSVEVTTDTISRWENKRYPTIKKENALRLAEALEVGLDEILDTSEETEEPEQSSVPPPASTRTPIRPLRTIWPLLLLSLTIAALIVGIGWVFMRQESTPVPVTAKRTLPDKCAPGQPFPVSIEVNVPEGPSVALIIKEELPENIRIITTQPALAPSGQKNHTLKWLHKVEGKMMFTYIASLDKPMQAGTSFAGTVAAGDTTESPVNISGNSTIEFGTHHWADSDGDNIISDKEILIVYDQYGDIEQLGINIDLIEEIWLGSGYQWNNATLSYEIRP